MFDGEEGQYLAEAEEYDLIILDIMLPKGVLVKRTIEFFDRYLKPNM